MKRRIGLLISCWVAGAVQALTVVQVTKDAPLNAALRSRLENLACRPFGVGATEMLGFRPIKARSSRAVQATVSCAPHQSDAAVSANYRVYCELKARGWTCDEKDLFLRRQVNGAGAFDIAARGLTFDEAQEALACLEKGLGAHPEALASKPLTAMGYLYKAGPASPVQIDFQTADRCFLMTVNSWCAAEESPPAPVVADCTVE